MIKEEDNKYKLTSFFHNNKGGCCEKSVYGFCKNY